MTARRVVVALTILTAINRYAAGQSPLDLAGVPHVIRVDGRVSRGPGIVTATAAIYDAQTDGSKVWEETQPVRIDINGRYVLFLGAATPGGVTGASWAAARTGWLETRLDGAVTGPRVPLTSVPYALKAADAETLGGWPASAFVRAPAAVTATAGVTGRNGAGADGTSAAGDFDRPALNTGTANFLGTFVNALDLTSSILHEDTGRIGLGTGAITPFDGLHVRLTDGSGGLTGLAVQNMAATGYSGMLFYDHTGALGQFQGFNNGTKEYRINNIAAGGSINFLLGGTSRLRIRPDGDLDLDAATSIRRGGGLFVHTRGGVDNVALGLNALPLVTTSGANVAIGTGAARNLRTGAGGNVAIGEDALAGNTTGIDNVAVGLAALSDSTGSGNIAIGDSAGVLRVSGDNNIYIGAAVATEAISESSTIRIGNSFFAQTTVVGGVRNVTTGLPNAVAVVVDGAQQLGTVSSSRRYKTDIRDMGDAGTDLMRLRPVVFRYARPYDDGSLPIQYGLIAEEVAEVFPDAVSRDPSGAIETVQYHKIDAMLLAEVQKHGKTLRAQADELNTQRAAVAAQAGGRRAWADDAVDLDARLTVLERRLTSARR